MERTFETFYPNQYTPEEQEAFDAIKPLMEKKEVVGPFLHGIKTIEERDLLEYARLWNPYNPLYNDPAYAAKTRWGRLPAMSCAPFEENISGFPMLDDHAAKLGDLFYYGNDGGDIELYTQVYPGDQIYCENVGQKVIDLTPPEGSATRTLSLVGEAVMKNGKGEIIGRGVGRGRNAFKRFTDGGPVPDDYAQTYEWTDYAPALHITTEEEWDRIKALWKGEKIRGAETLYWDDVNVGDEPTPTCEAPVSDLQMVRLHSNMILGMPDIRVMIENGEDLITDPYGQKIHFVGRHYSYCRNPKARALYYNFTARNFILRMVTNWMGDDGFICGLKWRFMNLYAALAEGCTPGSDILEKVPYMKGKYANRHGMEGDACICKGYVTDKSEENGKHYVTLACWGETLDGEIIQVMEIKVELPKRG